MRAARRQRVVGAILPDLSTPFGGPPESAPDRSRYRTALAA